LLDAACSYRGFRHRRLVLWVTRWQFFMVVDRIDIVRPEAKDSAHTIRQFWHCGAGVQAAAPGNYRIGGEALLVLPPAATVSLSEGGDYGWQSDVPGQRAARPVIIREENMRLPAVFAAVLFLKEQGNIAVSVEAREECVTVCAGARWVEVSLAADPIIHWNHEHSLQ
jgi:hypothetical protein